MAACGLNLQVTGIVDNFVDEKIMYRKMTAYIRACILILCIIGASSAIGAVTVDEAKALYRAGRYAEALPAFQAALAKKPADGSLNHWTGVCLLKTGHADAAKPLLETAAKKRVTEAPRYLAEIAFYGYDVDAADGYIDDYRAALKRAKTSMPPDAEALVARIDRMRAMLDRVEKIVVIDSIAVDRDNFFEAYRLSPESGSLYGASTLPEGFDAAQKTVVYTPQSHESMIWGMPDKDGHTVLVESSELGDDTWERPHTVGAELNGGANADYPFVMSDGITLYYASDGEGSLGGYDIFISRREDNEFLAPQNIGMPYNSPYDDYLLAIDELTGVGWWATDRNRLDGKITIYKFIPSDLRVNYSVDEPRLAGYARLDSYRDTWVPGADYTPLLKAIEAIDDYGNTVQRDFELGFPDGRVYTTWDNFRNPTARRKMEQYVDAEADFNDLTAELDGLRRKYGAGDTSVAQRISELEKMRLSDRVLLRKLMNEVITLEK